MDEKEMEARLKGADDFARVMFSLIEQMNTIFGRQMTDKDRESMKEMLLGIRNLLEETYKRKVRFLGSIK